MLRPVAVATLTATLVLTAAPSLAATAPAVMTAAGIGPIKIGATAASLQQAGLIGKLKPGCELNVPRGSFANVRGPFTGSVGFDSKKRVTSVNAWKGAVDRFGLTVGSTDRQVLAKYPHAHYLKAKLTDPIPVSLIAIGNVNHPRYSFSVDPKTRKVIELDNPYAQVCE
jgi:hypothetical protein